MGYPRLAGLLITIALAGCAKGSAETSSGTSASSSAGTGGATSTTSGSGGATGSASGTGGAPICHGDCAEPACLAAGYLCVEPITTWSGPVILFDGDPATLPAACPAAFPDQVYSGVRGPVQAAPAQCGACACGAGAVSCAPGAVHLYTNIQCTNPEKPPFAQPAGAGCQPIATFGSPNNPEYLMVDAPAAVASCPPSGGDATLPTATWTGTALACGPATPAACGGGSVCLPPAPAPFGGKACIYEAGDLLCPALYPNKHRLTGASDTRGCSACACASSSPAACTATTTFYGDTTCTQTLATKSDNGICGGMFGFVQAVIVDLQASGTASCAPAGGQPTGLVTDDGQVTTFCCVE